MYKIHFVLYFCGSFLLFVVAATDRTEGLYYSFISSCMITLSGRFFCLIFSSSPSLTITAGFRNRQEVNPVRGNLHNSFHSGYPLQAPLQYLSSSKSAQAQPPAFPLFTPSLTPPFVNLIKAAIKQRFICLGPNLPYRHHVTTYAVHTCRVSSQPRLLPLCTTYTLTQPVPGTSTDSMSAVQAYPQHSYI